MTSLEEKFSFTSTGDKIIAVLSEPEEKTTTAFVLLHCFTCTKYHRVIRNVSEALNEKGITTLRFDFSGNGESEGKIEDAFYTKMISEVKSAVTILKNRGYEQIGVGGHSLGAMIALLASSEDERVSSVLFIAGSSEAGRVREVFPKEIIEKAEKEGVAIGHAYDRDIPIKREFLRDLETYDVKKAVSNLKRPITIIHPIQDEIIPVFHARQLYDEASEPKKLHLIDGCDHLFKMPGAIEKLREIVKSV
ncbi:alpha/beta fold hydrolase [Candidatus Micrarchaeota archaeon]|nr:alpha/beta fold hydrolase [Candidatus Micrarchaeota archaeon]